MIRFDLCGQLKPRSAINLVHELVAQGRWGMYRPTLLGVWETR